MIYKKDRLQFKINYQLILLIISVVLSSYGIFKQESALYSIKNNPDFSIGETPTKVCYFGINSIISGKALSHYFSKELFDYLKDNPNILNLDSDDKIINVIYRDEQCKVITKNNEKLRGFIVPLDKSMSFPLYYQITTIKEDDVSSIEISNSNKKGESNDYLSAN